MSGLSELPQDQILGGGRFDEQPQDGLSKGPADEELETSVLVAGGGPVGMLLAYTLSAYHQIPCVMVEQSSTTTKYPKMEYSNVRSMEIYRQLGLADQLRDMGVDPELDLKEIIATGFGDGRRLITTWERDSPAELQRKTKEKNDGTGPREAYVRCHQIPIESWLKRLVESQEKCQSRWNCKFLGLEERPDEVVSDLQTADGKKVRVKSKFVVGCDGGGSLVRKAIGRESKRTDLDLDFVFIHFRSRDEVLRGSGHFWHANLLNGAIIVYQGKDEWTMHYALPPGGGVEIDPSALDAEKFVSELVGGLGNPVAVKIDEVYVKGRWGSRVAIADSFRSAQGRVFLAGDAAHQLSPVGGHGLNTGIGGVWDISWKLAAVLKGWGGPQLLESYDNERRPVAHSNLANVMRATEEVAGPMFRSAMQHGVALVSDGAEGDEVRDELAKGLEKGHWLHNQVGKILGYCYKDSPIVSHEPGTKEPEQSTTEYLPSTFPGARTPHIFLNDGSTSIFDLFGKGFTLVDFDGSSRIGEIFTTEAKALSIPLKVVSVPNEPHVRSIWERDVVLVRPDGHVAWRLPDTESSAQITEQSVREILRLVSGNAK